MDETLFTAARRAVKFFNIDMNNGGLMTTDTEKAMHTLNLQVELTMVRLKRHGYSVEPEVTKKEQQEETK